MKMRFLISALMLLLIAGLIATGQKSGGENKHFAKDGLSFDYSNGWVINDESNQDAQVLTLTRNDSDALIKLFVHRGQVSSTEKMAAAKTQLIDPYVELTMKQFVQMGAKPQRVPASAEIAGAVAEGVRIQATLDEPGEADIYWLTLGNRVAVFTFFGPESALKKATPTWDLIRNSVKIEPSPATNPSPTPTPKP